MLIKTLLAVLFLSAMNADLHGDLSLTVNNIRDTAGEVYVLLYNYANQNPSAPYRYYSFDKKQCEGGSLTVLLKDLPFGKYSITVLDDKNANQRLDKILGIPTEGYGFSSNSGRSYMRFPEYQDLILDFQQDNQRCVIELRYIF